MGTLMALAGGVSLLAGLLHAPVFPQSVAGMPGWTAATLAGFLLGLTGVLLAIFSIPRHEPPAPAVPAHVAFTQKKSRAPLPMLDRVTPTSPMRQPARTDASLVNIEAEIRDITRRINRAGVMLATGQLSDQGYAQYVSELKQRRGNLEAHFVRAELRRKL